MWAAESRDDATGNHIRRVGLYSAWLAQALGWEPERVESILLASKMHDVVGKIGVPEDILLKADDLTEAEFGVIKKHTEKGARILRGSQVPR